MDLLNAAKSALCLVQGEGVAKQLQAAVEAEELRIASEPITLDKVKAAELCKKIIELDGIREYPGYYPEQIKQLASIAHAALNSSPREEIGLPEKGGD